MGGRFLRGLGVSLVLTAACVGDSPTTQPTPDASNDAPASADAGSDAKADVVGPWTPAVLDGAGSLALWLEASSANVVVSSGNVGKWKDQSKNKTDAVNANTGPTVLTGAVNGHDALHFGVASVTLAIADAASLHFGSDQVLIEAVTRSQKTRGYVWSKATAVDGGSGPSYVSGLELFTETPTSGTAPSVGAHVMPSAGNDLHWGDPVFTDTAFHLIRFRRINSSKMGLQVDDQAQRTAPSGAFDVNEPANAALIGAVKYGNINPQIDFDVAELVIVHDSSGVVADGDADALHAYLKKKYAL